MNRPAPSCRAAVDDDGPSTLNLNDEPTRALAIRMARHKARQLAARTEFSPADREDLAQELLLHVIRRAPKFDPSKGSVQAFIATLIARRAASLLRRETAAKRDAHQCCSLNMLVRADDGTRVELASTITEDAPDPRLFKRSRHPQNRVEMASDVATVLSRLPADMRALCERLKRQSLSAAARALGVPRSTLATRLAKLRKTFAAAGLAEYL